MKDEENVGSFQWDSIFNFGLETQFIWIIICLSTFSSQNNDNLLGAKLDDILGFIYEGILTIIEIDDDDPVKILYRDSKKSSIIFDKWYWKSQCYYSMFWQSSFKRVRER